MQSLVSQPCGALRGDVSVPGDKSISHRALILSALAIGRTTIRGLLDGEDVLRTAQALGRLGVRVEHDKDGTVRVDGVGVGGLAEPDDILDFGNSGTGARLFLGLLATHGFDTHVTGDESLRMRPMARVTTPLEQMGASFIAQTGGTLPLLVRGTADAMPIVYETPVPSAQVKSAVLLAGLNAPGHTTVIESKLTRDHTERMLSHFGADVRIEDSPDGKRAATVVGHTELAARDLVVPGDPSSAAFIGVAASLVAGSEVMVRDVGLNPHRAGFIETLREMGADIGVDRLRDEGGEPIADLTFRTSRLIGVDVPAARAPSMIDEYPVIAVAAAFARGKTRLRGLAELRVKESDRLSGIADGLAACGVDVSIDGDDLLITGADGPPPGGGSIESRLDHRLAMAFAILGCASRRPVRIDNARPIATSFPGFTELMNSLGADLTVGTA